MSETKKILRRLTRLMVLLVAVWLVFCVGLVIAIHAYGQTERVQEADVIIILGAGMRYDGRPGPALLRRTRHAAALWEEGYAPVIICTGGIPVGRTNSESEGCRDVLIGEGIPSEAIYLETESRSTEENAIHAHEIMNENGWETAVLVSDAYHMLRAQWIFSSEGIEVYSSPTVNPDVGIYLYAVAREVAALQWQAIKQVFQLPVTYIPTL